MTTTIKPPPAEVRALLQRRVRLQELKQRCMDDAVMYNDGSDDTSRTGADQVTKPNEYTNPEPKPPTATEIGAALVAERSHQVLIRDRCREDELYLFSLMGDLQVRLSAARARVAEIDAELNRVAGQDME